MRVVMKFGGTSVGSLERIKNVASIVQEAQKSNHEVVVVLSAMAGATDTLLKEAFELSNNPNLREKDLLLATGEQKSIALLSLYLNELGTKAISLTGFQIPLITDARHGKARIQGIDTKRMVTELKKGFVVVVAGFQGVSACADITTLGRGGSDTSAVAIAAALQADACEIYTDVDGVFTTDPRRIPKAKLLDEISAEEMMELAGTGAKVLQTRSVELAAKYHLPLKVKNSLSKHPGTTIKEEPIEKTLVSGINLDTNEVKIAIRQMPAGAGTLAKVFGPLASANINVDMITENLGKDGKANIAFTVERQDLERAKVLTEEVALQSGEAKVEVTENIAKIALVGLGMRTHAGVAQKIFQVLADLKIPIQMVTTSEIKVTLVIEDKNAQAALEKLHTAFELDA